MFSIESLIEIQIVGILLLIAVSPLLNLLSPMREQQGFCPFFENIPDKSAKAIIILIMAFIIGVAGNRLIDDFIADVLYLEGRERYKKEESDFKKWAVQNNKLESIKLAEYYVSDNSQTARNYFERHKILMRILRGAALASLLMLLSMLTYQISLSSKKLTLCSRYSSSHFIIVFALLAIFSFAYKLESEHYYNRVADLYMNFDKIKPPESTNKK